MSHSSQNPISFDIHTTTSWLPFVSYEPQNTPHTRKRQRKKTVAAYASGGGDLTPNDWRHGLPVLNFAYSPMSGGGSSPKPARRRGVGIPTPKKNMGWVLYGSKSCPFCVNAKTWFDYNKIPVKYYDVDELLEKGLIDDRADLFRRLGSDRIGSMNTIPIIFYKGELIGGYTDLLLWEKEHLPAKEPQL